MSFTADVKTELASQFPDEYHCLLAEIAAILHFAGTARGDAEHGSLVVETENVRLAKKYLRLIKKAFNISVDLNIRRGSAGKSNLYGIRLSSGEDARTECGDDGRTGDCFARVWRETADWANPDFAGKLLEYSCCRRAFIRGAFLASGTISDPGKSYHFEIACSTPQDAEELARLIGTFDIEPKLARRKNRFLVYLKDSGAISDILGVMGAPRGLMYLENVRIIKDIKNSANRQSNCDSANISKTVNAAKKQLRDIRLIESEMGLEALPPPLREMAEVRLEHPEESLQELGSHLDPPVGKSGVNHRLDRLGRIAGDLRKQSGT